MNEDKSEPRSRGSPSRGKPGNAFRRSREGHSPNEYKAEMAAPRNVKQLDNPLVNDIDLDPNTLTNTNKDSSYNHGSSLRFTNQESKQSMIKEGGSDLQGKRASRSQYGGEVRQSKVS